MMLANAILLSSFEGKTIDLPLDEEAYERKLLSLIELSTFTKARQTAPGHDLANHFRTAVCASVVLSLSQVDADLAFSTPKTAKSFWLLT